jgi:hypothetical protein
MQPSYSIPSHNGKGFSTRFWRISILFGLPTVLFPYTSPVTHLFGLMLELLLHPSGYHLKSLISVDPVILVSFWWPLIDLSLLILGFVWDRQLSQGRISRAPIQPKILYAIAIMMNWLPFVVGIVMFLVVVFSKDGFVL